MELTPGKTYRQGGKPYHVTFAEDHEFADVEAIMRRLSMEAMLELSQVADEVGDLREAAALSSLTPAQADAIRRMFRQLELVITEWNVVDGQGEPVAPDYAGLMAQDPLMVMALFDAYTDKVLAVPPPLPGPSDDGGTSPGSQRDQDERSLALASSLPSQPSSETPG